MRFDPEDQVPVKEMAFNFAISIALSSMLGLTSADDKLLLQFRNAYDNVSVILPHY